MGVARCAVLGVEADFGKLCRLRRINRWRVGRIAVGTVGTGDDFVGLVDHLERLAAERVETRHAAPLSPEVARHANSPRRERGHGGSAIEAQRRQAVRRGELPNRFAVRIDHGQKSRAVVGRLRRDTQRLRRAGVGRSDPNVPPVETNVGRAIADGDHVDAKVSQLAFRLHQIDVALIDEHVDAIDERLAFEHAVKSKRMEGDLRFGPFGRRRRNRYGHAVAIMYGIVFGLRLVRRLGGGQLRFRRGAAAIALKLRMLSAKALLSRLGIDWTFLRKAA